MKAFSIKFDGAKASISICVECEGRFIKKTLTAFSGEDLWDCMKAMMKLDGLALATKAIVIEELSKHKERELIEVAIPKWLLAGGKIKPCPAAGYKARLSEKEQEDILAVMGMLEGGSHEDHAAA